jgi:putative transposase
MNTRRIASEYRLRHWAVALQERITNGESINDFCQSKGVSRNTYFYWQRKLRESACKELMPETSITAPVPQGWSSCITPGLEHEESTLTVEIGKFRVNIGTSVNTEQLKKIFMILAALC